MESKNTYKLCENKTITITKFHGKIYFHIADQKKDKNISFSEKELQFIVKKGKKLVEIGNTIGKQKKILPESDSDLSEDERASTSRDFKRARVEAEEL